MKTIYKFNFDCGRSGELNGIFVADSEDVKALFEKVEETDNGREFHPNRITSCRSYDLADIDETLKEIKEICAQ